MSRKQQLNSKPVKAILFARVSSREQEQGASIDAQIHNIELYCERHGLTLLPRRFTITESSTKGDRKKFVEMLNFAKSQNNTVAIVADCIDRIQRSFRESIELGDLCNAGKIELHFVRENLIINRDSNTCDTQRWDFGVMAAKTYVGNLRDNVKRSFKELRQHGCWLHKAPIGYKNIRIDGKATVIVDEERSKKVIRLFEEYATGNHSLETLTKLAADMGLNYPLGLNKPISRTGIAGILKNPFYYGIMRTNGQEIPHRYPKLISSVLFNQVQDMLEGRINNPTKRTYGTEEYAFRGIFRCHCGHSLTPTHIVKKNGKRYDYLFCNNKHCDQHPLNVAELYFQLKEEVFDPMYVPTELLNEIKSKVKKSLEKENELVIGIQKGLKMELTEAEQRQKRAMMLYVDGGIEKSEYEMIKTETTQKKAELEERLKNYTQIDEDIAKTAEQVVNIAGNVSKIFMSLNPGEKNQLLRMILLNCNPGDKKPQISLQKPFNFFVENPVCTDWLGYTDSNRDIQSQSLLFYR